MKTSQGWVNLNSYRSKHLFFFMSTIGIFWLHPWISHYFLLPLCTSFIIYTIILLKSVCLSVGVRKLQVAILARSTREMAITVCIVWQYILSRVRVSVRPSNCFVRKKHPTSRGNRLASVCVYFNDPATGYECHHGWPPTNSTNLYGDGVCVCSRMRVCACMRACVMCLQYTIIIFDPGW